MNHYILSWDDQTDWDFSLQYILDISDELNNDGDGGTPPFCHDTSPIAIISAHTAAPGLNASTNSSPSVQVFWWKPCHIITASKQLELTDVLPGTDPVFSSTKKNRLYRQAWAETAAITDVLDF